MYGSVPRIMPALVSGAWLDSVDDGRPCRLSPQLCQPEVEQLDARPRQHDVGGLQVAMDDALLVGGGERVGDLDGVLQGLLDRQT